MRAQILSVADRGEQARCHAEGGGRNAVHCGSPNEFILSFRVTLSTKQHFEAGFVLGCINEPIIAPFSPKTMLTGSGVCAQLLCPWLLEEKGI